MLEPAPDSMTGARLIEVYLLVANPPMEATYPWYQKRIRQAVKVGVGYAKKEEDLKLVLA